MKRPGHSPEAARAPAGAPRAARRRRTIAFAVSVTALAAAAWWAVARERPRGRAGLSVLLITVDTLRADALGRAGGDTPWMDRLAAEGVRFEDAHAHNVVTLPSHANILSGRYPFDHGVRDNAGFRFPAGVDTLASLLAARGYRTAAFVSAFPLDSRFGLARGFDVYDDDFVGAEAASAFLLQERTGAETVARARRWLDAAGPAPTLTWVHVFEPHFPYEPPEPWATRFRGREYEGEVAATDALLRPLLEPILARGGEGRTLVVLTADHGEALGEHGEATHGIFAYESTLKVPLVLYCPVLLRPGIARGPARHVDVLPTILDAVALPRPQGLPGRSLLSDGDRDAPPAATYFEALSGQLNRGWAPLHGILRGREKYIDLPVPELYDLGADSREVHNLAGSRPSSVAASRAALSSLRSADRGPARSAETVETAERLRSLGYATAAAPAKDRYTADDDPKRLIAVDSELEAVVRLYQDRDLAGALAHSRDLVRRHPGMALALLQLAHLERESGNLAAGIEALRRVVSADAGNETALALLGTYLVQAGRAAEAARLLEPLATGPHPDTDVVVTRAIALARSGSAPEAVAALDRAREADPTDARILVHLGTVHLVGGDRARARAAFAEAVERNPGIARAHSSLGMMAAEEGHPAEARAHWTRAIALDPRESGKLLALASLLGRARREEEAREYLELFAATAPPDLYAREIERARQYLARRGGPRRR